MKSNSNEYRKELSPWNVKSSKIVLEDKWIKVRADECVTQDGTIISPYYVLEYSNWVHMVVVNEEGKVLIAEQYRHGAGKISFELPCGTEDQEDKEPLKTAQRELLEETGYSGKFELAGKVSPNPATHNNSVYIFLVTNPVKETEAQDDPTEIMNYTFMDVEDVYTLIDSGEFLQALHVSSLFIGLRLYHRKYAP